MAPPAAPATPVVSSSASLASPMRPVVAAVSSLSSDPSALSLLDSLDAYTSSRATAAAAAAKVANSVPSSSSSSLDPIDFLNRHYTTESALVAQLPCLRNAVSERMSHLDERISNALQRQSETADATRRHVQDAKASVESLERRIRLVQEKASQSERAVLEITKDMKRLDCAKRHLQRTITTLKRLHMLVHAVEQLRLACLHKPFPAYKDASQLVDATRLLLKHFDAYTFKVEPMRLLGQKVTGLQYELRKGLVRGFRIVGFGLVKTLELEKGASLQKKPSTPTSLLPTPGLPADDEDAEAPDETVLTMPPDVLADGTLLMDAIGPESRFNFVKGICEDHLGPYNALFMPTPSQAKSHARANSFKISSPSGTDERAPQSLDQVERRFAWYRRLLREMDEKFPGVFPSYWNFHYALTRYFLEQVSYSTYVCAMNNFSYVVRLAHLSPTLSCLNQTKVHYFALLEGPCKDHDSENATILLKALQKTIIFEKEMMAWLQREYGTVFLGPSVEGGKAPAPATPVKGGDHGLEWDEMGNAVGAYSPEGIRIRYERQKKEQEKGGGEKVAAAALDEGRASAEQVPVEPLVGVGSSAFDNYLAPYIELEEQSMDEQLVESLVDRAVDARGELPVFTSSTALFVYIKGSITRCTALTKGRAFFLLYEAFQDALQKYATVLSGKLPSPMANIAASVSSFGKQENASFLNASYKIPPGGEVTVSHVISTCEYCVDTVEALEDLIRDTIDEVYKSRIDMTGQQEAFHDVIAKSIRVLVSGLENRMEGALKEMASINWSTFEMVGEESSYVRSIHDQVEPLVTTVRELVPASYFRSFCDKFAMAFTNTYYDVLIRLKRISEAGAQQLLLDVYNIKTLLMKLPVMEKGGGPATPKKPGSAGSTIAPAMYTKMVTKQFRRIETLLKLVSTPNELLIDVFRVQWVGGSALDLQSVMTLKGMKRPEQAAMLEKFGLDPETALKGAAAGVSGATIVNERVQALQGKSSDVAAKVNSDLNQMRQKVDEFRKSFR